jgi:hypothetical protein
MKRILTEIKTKKDEKKYNSNSNNNRLFNV